MRTVVAGVDSEQQSADVLRRALAEAQAAGRPLEVLHAWSTPTWASGAVGLDDTAGLRTGREEARLLAADLLGEARAARHDHTPVPATARGSFGDAGDVLVRASAEAGLVVVGGRRHGPLLSAVHGSATGYVLHHAPCPVMVVPRSAGSGPYRRVVVGYDDADHAGSALRWGLHAARRHGCPLLVLHAQRLTPSPVPMSAQISDAHREDEVHGWLAAQVTRASRRYTDVPVTTAVRDGSPLDVLLGEAGPEDLLVLGSRAHGGLPEVLLGAVAVQCAHRATGVVVVVRDGQERVDDPAPEPSRDVLTTSR